MGDSDDEREFGKRRDKFHTERRGQDRGDDDRRGGFGGGMDWGREPRPGPPMGFGGGGGFRGGRGPPMGGFGGGSDFRGRDRFSPERSRRHEMSPPPKRMRGGWEEDGFGGGRGGGGYDGGYDREERYDRPPPPRPSYREGRRKEPKVEDMEGFQPAMMSFKAFLQTQDDQISDEEAIRKYAEYKLEFKRQQLNEFFVTHKEEEWFRQKYHPEDSVKRKAELLEMLEKRIEVFKLFQEQGKYNGLALDGENQDSLVKLLDSVVIMLEGGTEHDLGILDMPDQEEEDKKEEAKRRRDAREEREKKPAGRRSHSGSEPPAVAFDDENARLMKKAKEFLNFMEPTEKKEGEKEDGEKGSKKRKHSETEQEAGGDEEEGPPGMEEEKKDEGDKMEDTDQKEDNKKDDDMKEDDEKEDDKKVDEEKEDDKKEDEGKEDEKKEEGKEENGETNDEKDLDAVSDGEDATITKEQESNGNGVEDEAIEKDKEGEVVEPENDDDKMDEDEKGDLKEKKMDNKDETRRPRALHKTSSIFLRNLAPTITKVEVEALCRRYEGFLRSAIADPAPDRRWFRRGWVTFKREVKIKDICFNLNNIRLRDCELGPIVNRDLTRRIRTVAGLTADKRVVRNDIKLAAKIITNLDGKWGLWKPEAEAEGSSTAVMGLASNNPLLANITDYLIEEASAEEEELLGKREGEEEEAGEEGGVQRDEELITVLDKMVLYLRIVHSVDFYNHSEYPNEDEMPNRCGILHARGIPPPAKVTSPEVEEYMKTFEKKMGGFLVVRGDLTPEEAAKFGLKVEADEVEKFIAANTQELGKDKWLCPLSGKKFKGPDFVRKHIMTKHVEKVDEVKKEVNFFNNYLRDPKRPQLPEHPTAKAGSRREGGASEDRGERRRGDPYEYSGPPRDITQRPVYGGGRERGWEEGGRAGGGRYPPPPPPRRERYPPQGPRGGFEGRPIITYRDWDAPNDDF